MATSTTTYTTFNGMLMSEDRDGVETFYTPDPLGNLVECRNASGTKTYSAEYWPYGEVQTSSGSNPSPWGFVGLLGYVSDSAEMLYVRARYLMCNWARWLTVDPVWPLQKAYTYVDNIPIVDKDPSGLISLAGIWCCIKKVLTAAVIGCLASLIAACINCFYAALVACAAEPASCSFGFWLCAHFSCGASAIACLTTAIAAILLDLSDIIKCILEGGCEPQPDPIPPHGLDDCLDRCSIFAPGPQHRDCMINCRGLRTPKPKCTTVWV